MDEGAQDDRTLISALLARDQECFRTLTRSLYGSMHRLAHLYCRSDAVCQEVIQETWLAVLEGLARFEARSSLRTWIFRILANRARSRAVRESRMVSLDALAEASSGGEVDGTRFDDRGMWAAPPAYLDPERLAASRELLTFLSDEVEQLPPIQRTVVLLRDLEGLSTEEVAETLEITDVHARVLLHRARTRLRGRVEERFGEVGP